jgi:hypothetical protein
MLNISGSCKTRRCALAKNIRCNGRGGTRPAPFRYMCLFFRRGGRGATRAARGVTRASNYTICQIRFVRISQHSTCRNAAVELFFQINGRLVSLLTLSAKGPRVRPPWETHHANNLQRNPC